MYGIPHSLSSQFCAPWWQPKDVPVDPSFEALPQSAQAKFGAIAQTLELTFQQWIIEFARHDAYQAFSIISGQHYAGEFDIDGYQRVDATAPPKINVYTD
eukprot:12403445-Karenia_brevis.AAC.1